MKTLSLSDRGIFAVTTMSKTQYIFVFDEDGVSGFRNPLESLHNPKEIMRGVTSLGNRALLFDVLTLNCKVGESMYMDIVGGTYGLDYIVSTPVSTIERIEND